MADQKITQLTADTAPTPDDLITTVDSPSGTPANKKVTIANLLTLIPAFSAATNYVATNEGTTSTSYTDLATSGPAVTLTTNTMVLVGVMHSGNAGGNAGYMSFAVSGATTVAASDKYAHVNEFTNNETCTGIWIVTGLTAGSNTFTAKYKTNAGTSTFNTRHIFVIPLN